MSTSIRCYLAKMLHAESAQDTFHSIATLMQSLLNVFKNWAFTFNIFLPDYAGG